MNFLLFFVSVIFWIIFYIFHLANAWWSFLWIKFENNLFLESISWNILIESIVFFIVWFFFFIWFSSYEINKSKKIYSFNILEIKKSINNFFKRYLYYFWFILSYSSIYFILKSFWFTDISIFILIVNLIVLFLFFLTNKFFLFRDYIKVNTILFSLYYLVYYIYYLIYWFLDIVFIDFINSSFILLFFILNFYNDRKLSLTNKSDKSLVFYFFSYVFISFTYYLSTFIWNISFTIVVFWALLSIFIYNFVSKIDFFKNNIILLRIISFLFLYISIIIWVIYSIKNGLNLVFFIILVYSIVFNFKTHYSFQNYISFFFSLFIFSFLIYYFYFRYLYSFDDGFIFLVLSLWLSLEFVVLTYFYKLKYFYDNYFIHIFSYIINLVSLIYFFIKFEFDFFWMWIILLIESIFVFLSYYKLKKIDKKLLD